MSDKPRGENLADPDAVDPFWATHNGQLVLARARERGYWTVLDEPEEYED